jgi:hypothetical protein
MARRFLNLVATAASMAALIAVTIPTSAPQVSSYASWRYFFLWAHISGGIGLRSPRLRSALMFLEP